jgi:hypothetical protein
MLIIKPGCAIKVIYYNNMLKDFLIYSLMASTSSLSNDLSHVFALGLTTLKRTELLLSELTGTLLLGVTDQLDDSLFVRSETGDFTDEGSDEGGSLGGGTLSVGWLCSWGSWGDLVALVKTDGESYTILLAQQ